VRHVIGQKEPPSRAGIFPPLYKQLSEKKDNGNFYTEAIVSWKLTDKGKFFLYN